MIKQDDQNQNSIFIDFKEQKLFCNLINNSANICDNTYENIQSTMSLFSSCQTYKESILVIKSKLTEQGMGKYRLQFKQFKYRKKSKFVNLKIKIETYNKIKKLAEKFDGIDDLLFDFFFDSCGYSYLKSINDLPSGSVDNDQKLILLLKNLRPKDKDLIVEMFASGFESGFLAGQAIPKCRSKKSLNKSISDALLVFKGEHFIFTIMNDDNNKND